MAGHQPGHASHTNHAMPNMRTMQYMHFLQVLAHENLVLIRIAPYPIPLSMSLMARNFSLKFIQILGMVTGENCICSV